MAQPVFVQKKTGSNANASSLVLTPSASVTAGDMLLVWVVLNANGTQTPASVAGITDSAGDIITGGIDTGVPVDSWVSLGNSTSNGIRIECWVCKGAAAITALTINLTSAQSIVASVTEYSSASSVTLPNFQPLQTNQNTITTNYIHEEVSTTPDSGTELMVGIFTMLGDTFNTTPLIGTARETTALNIPPNLALQILENGTVDSTGLLNLNAVSATQLATAGNVAASSMQAFYVLISGGLILNVQPGFNDQPDSILAANSIALGIEVARISLNAAFGVVRTEVFQGVYKNGDTVPLPFSPVDGYAYQINEVFFIWGVKNTGNPATGWLTGPDALWYMNWNVDQLTGAVTCTEWYMAWAHGAASTNDGSLLVTTIGIRQRQALTMAASPSFSDVADSTFYQDAAWDTVTATKMNENAKYGSIKVEVIDMGEFWTGTTIPQPVSPADGTVYPYADVIFIYSWVWTTIASAFTQPVANEGQFAGMYCTITPSTGAVALSVHYINGGGEGSHFTHTDHGRIHVWAICNRAKKDGITLGAVAPSFVEVSKDSFNPGSLMPAPILSQVNKNCRDALCVPELFTPSVYYNGDTVPLPTSPIDGYTYQREELYYISEWASGAVSSDAGHNRVALLDFAVDIATGLVTVDTWRLAPGGPYYHQHGVKPGFGGVQITVVGVRTLSSIVPTSTYIDLPCPMTPGTDGAHDGSGLLYYNAFAKLPGAANFTSTPININLQATLEAGTIFSGKTSLTIYECWLLITPSGATNVVQAIRMTFGGQNSTTIAGSATQQTDSVDLLVSSAYDYYLACSYDGPIADGTHLSGPSYGLVYGSTLTSFNSTGGKNLGQVTDMAGTFWGSGLNPTFAISDTVHVFSDISYKINSTNPPSDSGSAITDSPGQAMTVNGV